MYLYFLAHETKMAKFTTYVGTGNNLVTEKKTPKKPKTSVWYQSFLLSENISNKNEIITTFNLHKHKEENKNLKKKTTFQNVTVPQL